MSVLGKWKNVIIKTRTNASRGVLEIESREENEIWLILYEQLEGLETAKEAAGSALKTVINDPGSAVEAAAVGMASAAVKSVATLFGADKNTMRHVKVFDNSAAEKLSQSYSSKRENDHRKHVLFEMNIGKNYKCFSDSKATIFLGSGISIHFEDALRSARHCKKCCEVLLSNKG